MPESATSALPNPYEGALEWLFSQTRAGAPRDPARMRRLLTRLELVTPPRAFHIVGTAGKGTVASMVHAALGAAGMRSGLFVSPHVEDFRERIGVDTDHISEEAVLDFVRRVQPLQLDAAFFELTLALALEHFARENVQVAVLEAGVGARFDATSVIDSVVCTVITNVGEDHLETLGPRLEDVARDKAEAVRPGVPVVTGAAGEALKVICEVAAARGSPLLVAGHDPRFSLPEGFDGDAMRRANAALAAAALRASGLAVSERAILQGLMAPSLPGRAERFTVGGKCVVLDGAHNPPAARALLGVLDRPFVLVFGALARKAGERTLRELEPHARVTFVTQLGEGPSRLAAGRGRTFVADPAEALAAALAAALPGESVVVAGSLYLAGALRPLLRAQQPESSVAPAL